MPGIGSIIAATGNLSLLYAERLLKDFPAEKFARLAEVGGTRIQSNHPAFILGHLSLYPSKVMQMLDQPEGDASVPEEYESLFKPGVDCQDDPDGDIYPPYDELCVAFFNSYRAAITAVEKAPDEKFLEANPNEHKVLTTRGATIAFYLSGHVQNHLGQFSAWRRAVGLSPA